MTALGRVETAAVGLPRSRAGVNWKSQSGHDPPFSSQAERPFGWPLCPETGHPIDAINSESTHGSTWVNRSQISKGGGIEFRPRAARAVRSASAGLKGRWRQTGSSHAGPNGSPSRTARNARRAHGSCAQSQLSAMPLSRSARKHPQRFHRRRAQRVLRANDSAL